MELGNHFFIHSASVALHGGAYLASCGASSNVFSTSSCADASEHEFVLELATPGMAAREAATTAAVIGEDQPPPCSRASHEQCFFNDACMLEVTVRTRDERVRVLPEQAVGARMAETVARWYGDGTRPRCADVVIRCGDRSFPFYR